MSPHTVLGLVTDEVNNPVVLLAPAAHPGKEDLLLPVWLGEHEAPLISIALSGRRSDRPLTHDLLQTVIQDFGGVIERCELRLGDRQLLETDLTITWWLEQIHLDCRPADGIALAVRAGLPIHVAEDVIDRWGVVLESLSDVTAAGPTVSAFRRFLERVHPDDFADTPGEG